MIQRIQTLYLICVILLLILMFFFPIAKYTTVADSSIYILEIKGLKHVADETRILSHYYPNLVLLIVNIITAIVTVLFYKKRLHQIKLCILNISLLVGLMGLMYYCISTISTKILISPKYGLAFIFPLISIVLIYFAIRGITRDEKLVRSLDRLR